MNRAALLIALGLLPACATQQTPQVADGAWNPAAREPGVVVVRHFDSSRARQTLAADPTRTESDKARIRGLLDGLADRETELEGWVLPLMRSYLPAETPLAPRVYFGVGLPKLVEREPGGALLVDVGAKVWGTSVDELWATILREIYRGALLSVARAPLDGTPGDVKELTELALARLQVDGMVSYVARQGRSSAFSRDEYRIAGDRDEAADRFWTIEEALGTARQEPRAAVRTRWRDLVARDAAEDVFSVTGAWMAQEIEAKTGRAALVEAVVKGPYSFYEAYQKTGPGAMVNVRLPEDVPIVRPEAPVVSH